MITNAQIDAVEEKKWVATKIPGMLVREDGEQISFTHDLEESGDVDEIYLAAEDALDSIGVHLLLMRTGVVESGEKENESVIFTRPERSWQATHAVTFTPQGHAPCYTEFLMLCEEEYEGKKDGAAYSRDEWIACANASWGVVDGQWYCEGNATPGGANGVVEIVSLSQNKTEQK